MLVGYAEDRIIGDADMFMMVADDGVAVVGVVDDEDTKGTAP